MSSSAKRKLLLRRPVALDLGCSCRRRKLAYLFSFSPSKPKTDQYHSAPDRHPQHHHPQPHHRFWSYYPFSPSTATTSPFDTSRYPSSTSATTPSPYDVDDPAASSPSLSDATSWATKPKPPAAKGKLPGATRVMSAGAGRRRRVSESVAVVKDSHDPYKDFRDSMLQMILEKEIYAWEDLSELLHRFLALNSLCHHDAILRAFSEICNSFEAAT